MATDPELVYETEFANLETGGGTLVEGVLPQHCASEIFIYK